MIFGALGEVALGEAESGVIRPASIASAEAFDAATVTADAYVVYAVEIASAAALDTPSLVATISPVPIDSAENFPTDTWVVELFNYLPVSRIS